MRISPFSVSVVNRILHKPHMKLDGAFPEVFLASDVVEDESHVTEDWSVLDRNPETREIVTHVIPTQPVSGTTSSTTTDVTNARTMAAGDTDNVTALAPTPDVRAKVTMATGNPESPGRVDVTVPLGRSHLCIILSEFDFTTL